MRGTREETRTSLIRPLRADRGAVAAAVIAAAGAILFAAIAALTASGRPAFDDAVLRGLRDSAGGLPAGLEWAARLVTVFGGLIPLGLLTLAAFGALLARRDRLAAWWALLAPATGFACEEALKHVFDRPRPVAVFRLVEVSSPSFPSAHAMMTAIVFLTLALVWAGRTSRRPRRIAIFVAAAAASVAVGTTRALLGVHTPTDIVAGWAMGAAWATGCWLAARWLAGRLARG